MRVLHTDRLVLRPLRSSDLADVLPLAGDFRVARMLSDMPHPATPDDMARWLRQSPGERRYAIEFEHTLIGSAGYYQVFWSSCELGYWLGSAWWGRGFAREAAAAVLQEAVQADAMQKITASYFIDNPASGKVLGQLGFQPVGRRMIYCPARHTSVDAVACQLITGAKTRSLTSRLLQAWTPQLSSWIERGSRRAKNE
jgi:[ribosomal protein S5]-alanine N-acetyltransferase